MKLCGIAGLQTGATGAGGVSSPKVQLVFVPQRGSKIRRRDDVNLHLHRSRVEERRNADAGVPDPHQMVLGKAYEDRLTFLSNHPPWNRVSGKEPE